MVNATHQDVQFLDIAKGPLKEEVSNAEAPIGMTGPQTVFGHRPSKRLKSR